MIMKTGMKILGAGVLLSFSFLLHLIHSATNHGDVFFFPSETEDWIMWGIVIITFSLGLYLLLKAVTLIIKGE